MAGSSFFKVVIQLRSLTKFCQGSITLEVNSVSFPRESTATDLGIRNEVVLKMKYMVESWLPQELYLLKS